MATMLDLAEFYPIVLTKAPAAPIPEVENALRDAARTLCRRLKVWREEETFTITSPDEEPIYTSQEARIEKIEAAWFDGTKITFATPPELDEISPGWQDKDDAPARYVTQMQPNVLRLSPRSTGSLKVRMVLVPSLDCVSLPDFLLKDYGDILGDGAAGTLLAKSTNPEYSNPAVGSALLSKFNADLDMRDGQAARSQINAPHRARTRFF